jgi:hypothetical protein
MIPTMKNAGELVHSYCVAGLSVQSDIVFPGAIPDRAYFGAADVTVRQMAVPATLDDPEESGPTWSIKENRFLLRIPDIARFLLTGGREIGFEAENETAPEDIAAFLTGTVFGILLHQRRNIVLHASAVRVGGKAVILCGASGAGKSTLAAALVKCGYPLVTDDFCAVDVSGMPAVQPDGRQLKLWAQAIERLDLDAQRKGPVRNRLEKYYVEPAQTFEKPLPLGAVYALRETRPPLQSGIERPNIVDAALILRRNAYRPQLVRRMGQRNDYFRAAATIANSAGIFHLTRPLDFKAMADVVASLERHWRELGLTEPAP